MRKPQVITRCVANQYTSNRERIIEFSSAHGGGLISFFLRDDGTLAVQVYRTDPTVQVTHSRDDASGVAQPVPVEDAGKVALLRVIRPDLLGNG